jgi:hypothetical protein
VWFNGDGSLLAGVDVGCWYGLGILPWSPLAGGWLSGW